MYVFILDVLAFCSSPSASDISFSNRPPEGHSTGCTTLLVPEYAEEYGVDVEKKADISEKKKKKKSSKGRLG
jgi:hypothetical protein